MIQSSLFSAALTVAEPMPGAPRHGPRPLLVHIALAALRGALEAADPAPNPASPALPPLGPGPHPPPHDALLRFASGIAAYHRHPWRRQDSPAPVLWQHGPMRLLDYGPLTAPAVLFVPSLVNRGYILDLSPQTSLIRHVAHAGFRPLLLDWGWPDQAMLQACIADYVSVGVESAIAAVGQPLILAGYCMGGLLALAAALRQPASVTALVLLATPWDFRAPNPQRADALAAYGTLLEPVFDTLGAMPIDALQILFALQDPDLVPRKYAQFATLDPASETARRFVAIEDWANDCVPLAAPVARECLAQWFGANAPARGLWQVHGTAIAPHHLTVPTLVVVPTKDRIVPPESALPLVPLLRHGHLLRPNGGHVGMIAGPGAEAELWRPLAAWLAANALRRPAA